MRYFELLPIIDINNQQFRNLFKKVFVENMEDNQLIDTRINEYDTLTAISYNLYGSTDYWWVIACLNNIQDINFSIPLTNNQINTIAQENSTNYTFDNSIIISGNFALSGAENRNGIFYKTIVFDNDEEIDFYPHITPYIQDDENYGSFEYLGEYSCFKSSNNSFTVMMLIGMLPPDEHSTEEYIEIYNKVLNITFSYVVFAKPDKSSFVDNNNFAKIYEILLKDNDKKRNIKLIKPSDLPKFLDMFIEALNGQRIVTNKRKYTAEVNGLAKYDEIYIPESGVFIENNEYQFRATRRNVEIMPLAENYDTDNQLHISSSVNDENEIGNVGALGIDYLNNIPTAYHTGIAPSPFNYLVLNPSHIKYSKNGEVIKCGIGSFAGNGNKLMISFESDKVSSKEDVTAIITPIVDSNVEVYANNGNIGVQPVDRRTIFVLNTGDLGGRFFWALVVNNVSKFLYNLPGNGSVLNLSIGDFSPNLYNTLSPFIAVMMTEDSSYKLARLSNIGKFGFQTVNQKNSFNIYSSGEAIMPFVYKVLSGFQSQTFSSDENGFDIEISDYPSILSELNVNLHILPQPINQNDLTSYGNFAVQIIDKNNVKVFSENYNRYRIHVIGEWLDEGFGYFNGLNNPYRITLPSFDEIEYPENILLNIMPITENGHIPNVGNFCYIVRDIHTVDIYNTGDSNIRFKWCLLKKD